MRKLVGVTLLGQALLAGGLLLTESGRSTGRVALLVAGQFAPDGATPFSLMTAAPVIEDVIIPTSSGHISARLFDPTGDGPFGALILVAGCPSNIDDLQLSTLAADLARLGVVALAPRLPEIREGWLSPQDVEALVGSYQWLAGRPDVAATHVGFACFCAGSSLALLAAEDLRINEQVHLVNVFGGYFDLARLLHAVGTRAAEYNGQSLPWQPASPTVVLVLQNATAQLTNHLDGALLEHYADTASSHGKPQLEDLRLDLSLLGQVVLALINGTNTAKMEQLLAEMPPSYQEYLTSLSPSEHVEDLQADIFIIHDISDPFIPVIELYRLAGALGEDAPTRQATFELFAHVRPQNTTGGLILLRDGLKLIAYVDHLL